MRAGGPAAVGRQAAPFSRCAACAAQGDRPGKGRLGKLITGIASREIQVPAGEPVASGRRSCTSWCRVANSSSRSDRTSRALFLLFARLMSRRSRSVCVSSASKVRGSSSESDRSGAPGGRTCWRPRRAVVIGVRRPTRAVRCGRHCRQDSSAGALGRCPRHPASDRCGPDTWTGLWPSGRDAGSAGTGWGAGCERGDSGCTTSGRWASERRTVRTCCCGGPGLAC